jgi:tRNA(His) guanylyltransferase
MKDEMGDRMKGYENAGKSYLTKRTPVIIRIDGKAFHTYTRGFNKPFDKILNNAMQETMKYLCENIQNCKMGYTQSDEISLLLIDYNKLNTTAWFDNNVQKMVSIAASMATMKFNELMKDYTDKKAMFDARVFTMPREEVNNYFLWRQNDASRNSVSMFAQSQFSHKSLFRLSTKDLMDKLFVEKGINWNDQCTYEKRGSCAIKKTIMLFTTECDNLDSFLRNKWIIDDDIPIFSKDKEYIEKYVFL